MPATMFSHKEAAAALARAAGFSTGRFMLVAEFHTVIINAVHEAGAGPAALSVITKLGIERAEADSPESLVADLGEPDYAKDSGHVAETARADESVVAEG